MLYMHHIPLLLWHSSYFHKLSIVSLLPELLYVLQKNLPQNANSAIYKLITYIKIIYDRFELGRLTWV